MEQPITNIQVAMSIPPQKYIAATMEIMSQYEDVVRDALSDIKKDLMSNEALKEEVKNEIKNRLRETIENAIKSAARRVVWDLYENKEHDIEKMVETAILEIRKEK